MPFRSIYSLLIIYLILAVTSAEGRIEDQKGIDSDLEVLRNKIISELLETNVNEVRVERLMTSLQPDGSWADINYEDVSITGFEHTRHLNNLLQLSRAWRAPASPFHQSAELKETIDSALDYWIKNDFISDNWYHNEISGPMNIVRILLLMDTELRERQIIELMRMAERASLKAWGARPGGDMIRILGIMSERAMYKRDGDALEAAINAMAKEMTFTSGRGLKPDYSFHHRSDRVTSVLSYGRGYANAFADWAYRLADTQYSFPEETLKLLIDYFLDGISRTMVHGWYRDPGAMNRGMARPGALNARGSALPEKLLHATRYRADELESIINIRNGKQSPNLVDNRFFWHSEYMSHQRPNYFTSVRMHSARTRNMEAPHGNQGLKQHYFADGSNFISRTGEEYHDIFVAWDWRKIPGTTIVQKPSHPSHREIVKTGRTDFVGALSDSVYGLAAFDFESAHDPLKARKAWFFFDDEFVALGAGIESDSEYPAATTLNQSLLKGDVTVENGSLEVLALGQHALDDVSWVHHDQIAYLLPNPASLRIKNESAAGAWREINHQPWATDELVEKDLFTLWFDHSVPGNESRYEYIVIPDIEESEVESYRENLEIEVLFNTPELQAVHHGGLDLIQTIFYEPGVMELEDGITFRTESAGLFMLNKTGQNIDRITVADPTRLKRDFHIRLSSQFEGIGRNWIAKWDEESGYSDIRIKLPDGDYAGQSLILDNQYLKSSSPIADEYPDFVTSPEIDAEPTGSPYIGENYGGGIIFWKDENGESVLIAADGDQSAAARWSVGELKITNATGDGIGAGMDNSRLIVQHHEHESQGAEFAAKLCLDHQDGEYDDWYLPSKTELDLMYKQRDEIGGFANALYWSSTEYGIGFAWEQYFYGYGGQYTSPKGSSRVRCVRRANFHDQ